MADRLISIGIDPASTKLAIVALSSDGEYMTMYKNKLGKSGGQSCARARQITTEFIAQVQQDMGKIDGAYIESPVVGRGGVRSTMVQCFTSGAIQGALYEAGVWSQVANVSSWKKRVVGKGNATKEEVAEYLRLRWSAIYRSAEGNQDLIDASCIAIYGQHILNG